MDAIGDLVGFAHDKFMVIALGRNCISQMDKGINIHPLDFDTDSIFFAAHHVGSQVYGCAGRNIDRNLDWRLQRQFLVCTDKEALQARILDVCKKHLVVMFDGSAFRKVDPDEISVFHGESLGCRN